MSVISQLIVRTVPLMPKALVWRVAKRYVAGPALSDAVDSIRQLNELGAMATVDILGEEVTDRADAESFTEQYVGLYEVIEREGLDCNVSVKPTMLGLKIDDAYCAGNVEKIVAEAASRNNFLRIDMEDRTTTDATIRMYEDLHQRYGHVGTVFQAYMRRILDDIAALPSEGANIRLCKGIYIEPRKDAWKGYETVRRNFLVALEKLLRQGVYVGIATHDEYLVCEAAGMVDRLGIPRDRYEFQMLYGVDAELRDILIGDGHRLRIYVPYGRDWYLYSVRRMRENPGIAMHVTRAFLGIKP